MSIKSFKTIKNNYYCRKCRKTVTRTSKRLFIRSLCGYTGKNTWLIRTTKKDAHCPPDPQLPAPIQESYGCRRTLFYGWGGIFYMYTLRPYQQEAVNKLIWSQGLSGADLCILPTGAGKSIVIAELAHKTNEHILIIQPTKEILEQNVEKMRSYADDTEICIYSASVGQKDIGTYTFATIQSIYKKPEEFEHFGYVIIDECHLVNPKKKNSMFMTFLRGIGDPKVVGLTATPYRLDTTYEIVGDGVFIAHTGTKLINRVKGHFWKRVMYNVNIGDLIKAGHLTALKYIDKTIFEHKDIPTNISKSDFNLHKFEQKLYNSTDKCTSRGCRGSYI